MKREKKALKYIIIFFVAMIVLTVVSRAADSVTVPRVKTETMKSGTLPYSVSGEGKIAADTEQVAFLAPGGKPVYVVPVGTAVAEGDLLVKFDVEALQEKLGEAKAELTKLELSKQQESLGGKPAAQAKEQDLAARDVSQVRAQLDDARIALQNKQDEYNSRIAGEITEEERQALEAEIASCEDAVKTLEQTLMQAQNALADAQVNDANTAVNNKRQQDMSELAKQSIQVDIDQKQQEIGKLEELVGADGNVTAQTAGTVTEVTAILGTETSGQEYCKIGVGNGKMTAEMDRDDANRLKVQDKIVISASGGRDEINGTIESIQEEEDDKILITAKLDEHELAAGTDVAFQAEKESKEYKTIVPISAVREDSKGKYVLVIREGSTILGKEKEASRIDVKILEKNESSAAVDSALLSDDEMIVDSNKSIKEGDRVRKE